MLVCGRNLHLQGEEEGEKQKNRRTGELKYRRAEGILEKRRTNKRINNTKQNKIKTEGLKYMNTGHQKSRNNWRLGTKEIRRTTVLKIGKIDRQII